eukprot:CAMPEP_0197830432 /NCGR_PEP_ID=MMETSP1437-20131217/7040_1 /TAXON_ID=49252 ORGANISM="Eucampia antarctica, Strain CCMP1452" /NCGR_SAMPLE_ID=MMETSP1437 /ASSEMBLY_ACC=CAM_ASM_001096 /LENGTH=226 /DNA_ID=CAMNT_0043432843 /DNA_START=403 /DNA_END=1083 /DNA_ORIENTATION=+
MNLHRNFKELSMPPQDMGCGIVKYTQLELDILVYIARFGPTFCNLMPYRNNPKWVFDFLKMTKFDDKYLDHVWCSVGSYDQICIPIAYPDNKIIEIESNIHCSKASKAVITGGSKVLNLTRSKTCVNVDVWSKKIESNDKNGIEFTSKYQEIRDNVSSPKSSDYKRSNGSLVSNLETARTLKGINKAYEAAGSRIVEAFEPPRKQIFETAYRQLKQPSEIFEVPFI